MGVSDFSLVTDLLHKVRSLMAELSVPSPTGGSSCERLVCYDFSPEMDEDVSFSGTPESQVFKSSGRSNAAKFAGRQLFSSPANHLTVSTERRSTDEEDESDKPYFTPLSENLNPEYSDSDSTSMTNSPTKDETDFTPKSASNLNFNFTPKLNLNFDSDSLFLPPDPDESFSFSSDSENEHENENEIKNGNKVRNHFKALVAQLLSSEGVNSENHEGWIEIVAKLAWQAACFVKPDLRKGGSMDPCHYVKIKCIHSGLPIHSELVKGIVCTKNVKHKRMMSQHENPKILLLGGSLEYQKLSNKLASINHILEQEKQQLKSIVDKISSLKPHVLLVEKTASLMAQQILSNEISLVLNVKRPLLDRIASCTGADVVSSVEGISKAKLGSCQTFRTQKVTEFVGVGNPNGRGNNSKTLMFFEGCPRPLGCTVLLRGVCIEELKKVKKVVQLAFFAAYHLSLETSFLADEGASNGSNGSWNHWNRRPIEANNNNYYYCSNSNNNSGDGNQNILVSKSSSCVSKGTICEPSHIFRIKFYGRFDKPLGRYLCEDLFDETKSCTSCNLPLKSHVKSYTHQQGSLTIYTKKIKEKLQGEKEGTIWMWHRCIKCDPLEEGIRPATRRVAMSDSAWGISFGKFLELSFCGSNSKLKANRIAPCGHSLMRDCLRFFGFGSMVALFKYSPVEILNVSLPPSILDFSCDIPQDWIKREATMIYNKMECLHAEVSDLIFRFEKNNNNSFCQDKPLQIGPQSYLIELKDLLKMERNTYDVLLRPFLTDDSVPYQSNLDIIELNRLKQGFLSDSYTWDRRIRHLSTIFNSNSKPVSFLSFKTTKKSLLTHQLEAELSRESTMDPVYELEESSSIASCLSDQIDSAWTGSGKIEPEPVKTNHMAPVRIHSFDSSSRMRRKVFANSRVDPLTLTLTSVKSVDSFGNMRRTFSHKTPKEIENSNLVTNCNYSPVYVTSISNILSDGARFLNRYDDELAVPVYDDEPTSIISYALANLVPGEIKETHFRVSFEDNETSFDKARFSVNFYFAREFNNLREKCFENKLDFVRILSRCKRWSAKGGKSKVYFAKTLDERFIIKQVTKTELDSFEEFAPEYFEYLTKSLTSQNHSCLAKIFGIFQVCVKNMRGRETKMDMMIMENLFYKRNISRVYDLKGSVRSRYVSDASGDDNNSNKVLLDMNLLEALQKSPIFLGSFAKRQLERAVWNDTSFLASVDVMDYSLLVGIDEENKELVVGIIDFMRQYTWDKQLETWVKASGILGGPKNASPTIISPIMYKRRFRKAMSKYFQTINS
ncbi:hypothetical protein LUZ60_003141 [Juncus effusus]|nr:hypothetical protein LUZ60_003141 [Juncus effusus]